jgi:competence protein ComEC
VAAEDPTALVLVAERAAARTARRETAADLERTSLLFLLALASATSALVACASAPEPRRASVHRARASPTAAPRAAAPPSDVAPRAPSTLTVRFLDVGQGDAALVTTSDRHAILVDAGPRDGTPRVEAALRELGSTTLDAVILSHAHADHLGDLDRLTKTLSFASWVDPGFERSNFPPYARALANVAERGIPVRKARRGDRLEMGAFVTVSVLGPPAPLIDHTRSDINANSVVVRFDHHAIARDVRVLFTGDAEQPTEKRLLEDRAALAADVLKVAHHGSKHASTDALLDAVHPRLAVISCAVGNDYGHPHAETLARLDKHGIAFARTDVEGTITVTSDEHGLAWTTERPGDPAEMRRPGKGLHPEAAP